MIILLVSMLSGCCFIPIPYPVYVPVPTTYEKGGMENV